jgi:hypothetical protein
VRGVLKTTHLALQLVPLGADAENLVPLRLEARLG